MAESHSGHTLPPSLPGGPSDRPDTGRPTSGLSSLLQGATHCQALSSLGFLALSLPHLPISMQVSQTFPCFLQWPCAKPTLDYFLFFFLHNDLTSDILLLTMVIIAVDRSSMDVLFNIKFLPRFNVIMSLFLFLLLLFLD